MSQSNKTPKKAEKSANSIFFLIKKRMLKEISLLIFNCFVLFGIEICHAGYETMFLSTFSGDVALENVSTFCPNFGSEQMTPTLQHTLPLDFSITPNRFLDIDNTAEEITFHAGIEISWDKATCKNEDQLEGNGKNAIFYPKPGRFWTPGILLLGSRDTNLVGSDREEHLKLSVLYSSNAENAKFTWNWQVTGIFSFHCDLDLLLFPADVQNCSFQIQGKDQSLVYKFSRCYVNYVEELMQFTTSNSNWRFLNHSCQIGNGMAVTTLVTVSFVMARNPRFYMINVIGPCILLAVLELCSFALPAKGAERTTFTMSVYLAFVFLQSMLFNILPQTPKEVLLTQMIFFQSIVTTIITIYSAFLSRTAGRLSKSSIKLKKLKKISLIFLLDSIGFSLTILAYSFGIIWIYIRYKENYVEYQENL